MARNHRGSRIVTVRRATQWLASADIGSAKALANDAAVLDQSFTSDQPFTIVRTRGSIWISTDQSAAGESPFGALGFAVVSDQAAAIGVTAIPTPQTDMASDLFFVHALFAQSFLFATASGFESTGFERTDFDSKAMRKVNENETIVVGVENAAAVGMNYILQFRMLIKVH